MGNNKNHEVVKLKSKEKLFRYGWFVEKLVLHRWQYFKNNPTGNNLFIRAILCVTSAFFIWGFPLAVLIFMLILELKDCLDYLDWFNLSFSVETDNKISFQDIFLAFIGSISISYWNMSNLFGRKWEYCSKLYNDITTLKYERQEGGSTNEDLKKIILDRMRNALAIDLLMVDLWAHSSFSSFFYDEMKKSILDPRGDDEEGECEKCRVLLSNLNEGKLSEDAALDILEKRHINLFKRERVLEEGNSKKS